MKLFVSGKLDALEDKYLFLDNDFLGRLFDLPDLLRNCQALFEKAFVSIDTLISFEFLQSIVDPKQRALKEACFSDQRFDPVILHPETFLKIQENALLLSRIYVHQKANCHPSVADLFLAARTMLHAGRSYIVTGNKSDFPSCVFDLVSILSFETKDGSVRAFYVLEFQKEKFLSCQTTLEKVPG